MSEPAQPPLPSIQRGSGPALVLLHGFALSPNTYRRTIALLSDHVRVVAPMWLYVEGDWSEAAVVDALDATLRAVDADAVTLVGHSFGGAIAILLAASRPEAVEHLVLVNAMGGSTAETMRENALSLGSGGRLASLGAARDFLGSVTTRARDVARAGWWGYRRELHDEVDRVAATAMRRDVVWTRDDALLPVEDGTRLADRIGAGLTVVGGPGQPRLDHDWAYRRPERFCETLLGLGIADR